jgi:5'-nucleotidase
MTLTGAQLKRLLEQQWRSADSERARILQPSAGFTYRWDGRRPRGSRVEAIRLDGQPVTSSDKVRVTVNSFLADGGDGFRVLRDGRDRVGGPIDIDAFTDFLRAQSAGGPLAPTSAPRITRAR